MEKDILVESHIKIEPIVALFEVYSPLVPSGKFRVKILERRGEPKMYTGFPNTAVLDIHGSPDWTSGFGYSIEEALEKAILNLFCTIEQSSVLGELRFELSDPDDF